MGGSKVRYERRWARDLQGCFKNKPPHLKFTEKEHQLAEAILQKINITVALDDFKPGKKRNLILHVGRFFKGLHCKRQDMLVEMFKKLVISLVIL